MLSSVLNKKQNENMAAPVCAAAAATAATAATAAADYAAETRAAEARLVQAALDGDLSAFNCLVIAHQDNLFGWVVSLVKDEALADDLTQATLITAYEKLHTFRGGSFRAWLFTIARNRSIDELRHVMRFPVVSLDAPADEDDDRSLLSFLPDGSVLPEEALEMAEQAALIEGLLEALPEPARQVLQLVDMEGLDYQETATVLQLPLGTVKSRLTRARLKLRELMLERNIRSPRGN